MMEFVVADGLWKVNTGVAGSQAKLAGGCRDVGRVGERLGASLVDSL